MTIYYWQWKENIDDDISDRWKENIDDISDSMLENYLYKIEVDEPRQLSQIVMNILSEQVHDNDLIKDNDNKPVNADLVFYTKVNGKLEYHSWFTCTVKLMINYKVSRVIFQNDYCTEYKEDYK